MKYYLLLVLAVSAACQKDTAMEPVGFDVRTTSTTYHTGKPIEFSLSGRPDMIVFFSGERGKKYENRNRTSAAGSAKLVFQVSMQQGPVPPASTGDSLQLLVSGNLAGNSNDALRQATWTDITSRNTKWPASLGTGFVTSDSVDLTDFNDAPRINIAFRVKGKKSPDFPQRKWQIQNLAVNNRLPDGTNTALLASFAAAGWAQASLKNDNNPGTPENGYVGYNAWNVGTWNISTADSLRNSNGIPIRTAYPITFDPGLNPGNDENDDWLVATAVDLNTCQPDVGAVIKNKTDLTRNSFSYTFQQAGTYDVVFLASNASLKGESATVKKEIRLTIQP